jgi:hypothetical protein
MKFTFEKGIISPREGHFDHHGQATHSNSFILKMASVQMIEWWFAHGEPKITYGDVDFDHVDHIDNLIMIAFLELLKETPPDKPKIRALYGFACNVSVIDSCGVGMRNLLDNKTIHLLDFTYHTYHKECTKIGKKQRVSKILLPLSYTIEAAKKAAHALIQKLKIETCAKPTQEIIPIVQPEITKVDDNICIAHTNVNNISNIFVIAPQLFRQYTCIIHHMIGANTNRHLYTIAVKNPYISDLSRIWEILNSLEKYPFPNAGSWGGHSGIGGSPKRTKKWEGGSVLPPQQVAEIVQRHLYTKN